MNIENTKEKPFEEELQKKQPLFEGLIKYKEEGQRMIDGHRLFFTTFAHDISLSFKMSNAFYIDFKKGEVNLDTKWFADKEFSKMMILWANLHELVHFRDLADDPEGMMRNFDYIRQKAKKTGVVMLKKWEEKYSATDPEFIERLKKQRPISKKDPSITMNAVEQAAYQVHHTFYNIFDDIYVNNLIPRKVPLFEDGETGDEEVKRLYREKLFVKSDYSSSPRHLQLLYTLLREDMVKDEEVIVSGEVSKIMEQKIPFLGKEYTPKEIVDHCIKPKGDRDTKAGQRYFVLQNTVEPLFEELLMRDLAEWDPQKTEKQKGGEGEPKEGEGNPFDQDYQEYQQNNPDQIDSQDMRDWMDEHTEDKKKEEEQKAKEKEEESKSAKQREGESQDEMDREKMRELGIPWEIFQQYKKMEDEVAPYLEDLSKFWQRIIFGSTLKIERGMEGYFTTGIELDVLKTIEEWPKIEKGQLGEAQVMKKMMQKEVLIRKPELIRLRLVGDMSGSMNEEKKHVLQQTFVLLLSSLREFNIYLNLTRSQTKSKLGVDTEAWIFGTDAEKVKSLRSESDMDHEQVEIIKIFEKLHDTIGNTYDAGALEEIFISLTPEDKAKIKQEKIMEIVFEITDGGSTDKKGNFTSQFAREAVDNLVANDVIVGGFQIGAVSKNEERIFKEVWNKNREEPLGEIVGEKIENLLPAITERLKSYLGGVRV
ncbi:MAG TPA: vWA domain-containing protein [Patescibacteria group bacterium]|nr:vWA domain-containing protein [Patescibacteria group bacterium]